MLSNVTQHTAATSELYTRARKIDYRMLIGVMTPDVIQEIVRITPKGANDPSL